MNPKPQTATSEVMFAVVVPTRNRASLAMAACESLLAQTGVSCVVVVSDNSSQSREQEQLASYCRRRADPRLVYVRPETSLRMGEHWNWAIEQALARTTATHVLVHYDRRITKSGGLAELADLATAYPDALITFNSDAISNIPTPGTLWQPPWTGRAYRISTSRVVALTAQSRIGEMGHAFPILSNCVTPRAVLRTLRERFGDVCVSVGPDSCFSYRFCASFDHYLHCDRSVGILHGSERSNGLGYMRQTGGDFADFRSGWTDDEWLSAAPIPGLSLGMNMVFHDYELTRRTLPANTWPTIEHGPYLRLLESVLWMIESLEIREQFRRRLEAAGLPSGNAPAVQAPAPVPARPRPGRSLFRRVAARVINKGVHLWWTGKQKMTVFANRPLCCLWQARLLGRYPHISGQHFRNDATAVWYSQRLPRPKASNVDYIRALEPQEVRREADAESA